MEKWRANEEILYGIRNRGKRYVWIPINIVHICGKWREPFPNLCILIDIIWYQLLYLTDFMLFCEILIMRPIRMEKEFNPSDPMTSEEYKLVSYDNPYVSYNTKNTIQMQIHAWHGSTEIWQNNGMSSKNAKANDINISVCWSVYVYHVWIMSGCSWNISKNVSWILIFEHVSCSIQNWSYLKVWSNYFANLFVLLFQEFKHRKMYKSHPRISCWSIFVTCSLVCDINIVLL